MSQTGPLMGFVHRRRRGAELFLLVLALAVGIGAYAAVGLGVEGAVPADMVGYGGWLTGRFRTGQDAPDNHRSRMRSSQYDLTRPENQAKLEAAEALAVLADDGDLSALPSCGDAQD